MVPPEFTNFFIASASAGGALVGLLFVAVSIAPERIVIASAPAERQAVAGSSFTALVNAFFISLFALIPHFNLGILVVLFSGLCLLTTFFQAWNLLRLRKGWLSFLRRSFLIFLSVGLYSLEMLNGFQLITAPSQVGNVYSLIACLLGALGLGLIRAWELLGSHRYGFFGWLNPLHDLDDTESSPHTANSSTASSQPTIDEPTPVPHRRGEGG